MICLSLCAFTPVCVCEHACMHPCAYMCVCVIVHIHLQNKGPKPFSADAALLMGCALCLGV